MIDLRGVLDIGKSHASVVEIGHESTSIFQLYVSVFLVLTTYQSVSSKKLFARECSFLTLLTHD